LHYFMMQRDSYALIPIVIYFVYHVT